MPDIFISYKKEERETANLLAARLTESGYDVWWDDALLAGERFEDEITSVLDDSGVVVVLWSKQSVKSDWVKAEAETARQQRKALPVIIDDLPAGKMPLLYRGMHTARLTGWNGDTKHEGYVELIGSIGERLGRATGPKLTAPEAEAKLERSVEQARDIVERKPPAPRSPLLVWGAILAAVLVAGLGGGLLYMRLNPLSAAEREAVARCETWSQSARLDAATGLPRLSGDVGADCALASSKLPDNGDYLGMLAMVRLAENPAAAPDAITLASRGAEKQSPIANYVLGAIYERGLGVMADRNRALTSFKTAHDLGLARATGKLCLLTLDNGGTLTIGATALDVVALCNAAAEKGDALGQIGVGYMFETNLNNLAYDPVKSASLYQSATDQGSDEAAVALGILYDRGLGVVADPVRAVSLYQSAADNKFPGGLRSLAISLELGNGIAQDFNRAARLYEQASVAGDAPALLLSGYVVSTIVGGRSVREIELLAGPVAVPTGQRLRGQMLAKPFNRTQDLAAAEAEFVACAAVRNPFCEVALGYFYHFGSNGTRDPAKALPYYESAAATGNLFAQYYLAYCYEWGDGVPKDQQVATQYYQLAAAQGHLSSINRLMQRGEPVPDIRTGSGNTGSRSLPPS